MTVLVSCLSSADAEQLSGLPGFLEGASAESRNIVGDETCRAGQETSV